MSSKDVKFICNVRETEAVLVSKVDWFSVYPLWVLQRPPDTPGYVRMYFSFLIFLYNKYTDHVKDLNHMTY